MKRLVMLISALLCGCSSAGPGLANHPLDCAIGVTWGDCLPGTAGYRNGGGQQTKSEQVTQKKDTIGTPSEDTMNLQPGDLVQLKSGGPIMTIKSISDGEVRVDYFLNGKREFVDFAPSQLKRADVP